ncbi:MAG: UDP-3-O-(3-hydroxymyristoyl)glucosamine N-acyltransferase [Verrucomicrobia bacterium]|nr:UDP-3-O-(3-hydroxymyristoyl)glucosamine N-acyltransferase [Verrucomicrobiota bacterium]MDA1087958.1 UDP-3-O-(3-hydroxymyristoyl)glucosamine N-acyltransferase [Verrucomicrobiota bacterium]
MSELSVEEVAIRLGGVLDGPGGATVSSVCGVRDAARGDLTFVSSSRYARALARSEATAALVPEDFEGDFAGASIRVSDPERAIQAAAEWFCPRSAQFAVGVHPSASVCSDVSLGDGVSIGPACVIEPGAEVGDHCVLVAGVYIGHRARIGSDCRLYANVCIREDVEIGDRAIIHDGAVIGSDGYGYRVERTASGPVVEKIPQRGTVIVGNDVEIGANTTIDRARIGATRIGNGVKIDNLVMIAHNVTIGDFSGLAAQVGIAGSASIGSRCFLRGQVGVSGHVHIGDDVEVGGNSTVTKDIAAGKFVSGEPARDHDQTTMIRAHLWRLPRLRDQVSDLQKRIEELEERLGSRES